MARHRSPGARHPAEAAPARPAPRTHREGDRASQHPGAPARTAASSATAVLTPPVGRRDPATSRTMAIAPRPAAPVVPPLAAMTRPAPRAAARPAPVPHTPVDAVRTSALAPHVPIDAARTAALAPRPPALAPRPPAVRTTSPPWTAPTALTPLPRPAAPARPAASARPAAVAAPAAPPAPAERAPEAPPAAADRPTRSARRASESAAARRGAASPGRRTLPAPPAAPGVHRLPAPPTASVRGRITIAAVAAGAAVAGGQTLVTPFVEAAVEPPAPVTLSALLPVAESTTATFAVDAIGGDQLIPASIATADAGTAVDVQNLTKAVEIGQEISRRQELVDTALVDGAPSANLVGDEVFVQPTTGRYTSGFGGRWGRSHNGIDIAGPIGTPIYAFTDGVVEKAGAASGFGQWVVLRHADGTKTVYGHVNRFFVREGQEVRAGEQIAEIGNRGFSTGPHLHFEIYDADDTALDPRPYLDRRGVFGF